MSGIDSPRLQDAVTELQTGAEAGAQAPENWERDSTEHSHGLRGRNVGSTDNRNDFELEFSDNQTLRGNRPTLPQSWTNSAAIWIQGHAKKHHMFKHHEGECTTRKALSSIGFGTEFLANTVVGGLADVTGVVASTISDKVGTISDVGNSFLKLKTCGFKSESVGHLLTAIGHLIVWIASQGINGAQMLVSGAAFAISKLLALGTTVTVALVGAAVIGSAALTAGAVVGGAALAAGATVGGVYIAVKLLKLLPALGGLIRDGIVKSFTGKTKAELDRLFQKINLQSHLNSDTIEDAGRREILTDIAKLSYEGAKSHGDALDRKVLKAHRTTYTEGLSHAASALKNDVNATLNPWSSAHTNLQQYERDLLDMDDNAMASTAYSYTDKVMPLNSNRPEAGGNRTARRNLEQNTHLRLALKQLEIRSRTADNAPKLNKAEYDLLFELSKPNADLTNRSFTRELPENDDGSFNLD